MISLTARIGGIHRLIVFGMVGLLVGVFVGVEWNPLPLRPRTEVVPASYRLSKIPGGAALRLAMVHDVLHERYLRHGAAWYARRNLDARKIINEEAPAGGVAPSGKYLDAFDDLSVGLERIGQLPEARSVEDKKLLLVSPLPAPPATRPVFSSDASAALGFDEIDRLDLQRIENAQTLTTLQHHQYTALANLGTILIHDALDKLLSGKIAQPTRSEMGQSLEYIERALAINPGGHFGRETWQAITIEHFRAALDHPELLQKYDLIGEPLKEQSTDALARVRGLFYARRSPDVSDPGIPDEQRLDVRGNIDRVGINPDWAAEVNPDYSRPMPFDEPTLAIVGMWTLGLGPNAHFCLALGRMMENLGQNEIAWDAYERAVELEEGFWPDPAIRATLVEICRARQEEIAEMEDSTNPADWQNRTRARHVAELAWGIAYQKAYWDFEGSQIAAGVRLDDPNFYTAFYKDRPSIASLPGLSDDLIVTHEEGNSMSDLLPCLVLGFGIGMFAGLIIPEKKLS